MDKSDPPLSFGVFKPVGHVVVALPTMQAVDAACAQLLADGFQPSDLVRYTPLEMRSQVNEEIRTASFFASIGQDLNLIRAHGALAEAGSGFLVVKTDVDAEVEKVAAVARGLHSPGAQRYGRFIVEELIERVAGDVQSPESDDTGLDLDAVHRRPD